MDVINNWLLHANPIFVAAIFGAIGGVLGGVLTLRIRAKWVQKFIIILCALGAAKISPIYLSNLQQENTAAEAINEIENLPLYKTIIFLHPREKAPLEDKIREVLASTSYGDVETAMSQYGAELAQKYLKPALPYASGTDLHTIVFIQDHILKHLQSEPGECVSYFNATLTPDEATKIPASFIRQDLDAEAKLLIDVNSHPYPPPPRLSKNKLINLLVIKYKTLDIPEKYLVDMTKLNQLSTNDACQTAIKFETVLLSFDKNTLKEIYESLLTSGK